MALNRTDLSYPAVFEPHLTALQRHNPQRPARILTRQRVVATAFRPVEVAAGGDVEDAALYRDIDRLLSDAVVLSQRLYLSLVL